MFTILWTLYSSLCTLVAAIIIAQTFFGTNSPKFIGFGLIVHWILLGLEQWQLLKPYIINAYNWGVITIVGGIICSFLLGLGYVLAFFFSLRNGQITNLIGGRSSPSDIAIGQIITIVSFFVSGFALGWMQKLVIQHSVNSAYITYLPIINGFTWLLCLPLIYICIYLFSLAEESFFSYVTLVFFCAVILNLIKGLTVARILDI